MNDVMKEIPNIGALVDELRSMSKDKLEAMHKAVETQRHLFVFHEAPTEHKTTVNAIMNQMCLKAGGPPKFVGKSLKCTTQYYLRVGQPVHNSQQHQKRRSRAIRS